MQDHPAQDHPRQASPTTEAALGAAPGAARLRLATGDDRDAIAAVVRAAFAQGPAGDEGDAVAAMVDGIRAGSFARPELEWVAEVDGRIVGHVALSGTTLRTADGDRTILMLTPLSVAPDRQRTGVGSALTRHVLRLADDAGEPLVIVEGDPAYYGRLGFEPAAPHGIEIALPDWAPPEAAQVALLGMYAEVAAAEPGRLQGRVVHPPYVPTDERHTLEGWTD